MDLFSGGLCPEAPDAWTCPTLAALLALLEGIPALLWATDRDLRITSLTGAGLATTGISATDYTGKPVESLFRNAASKPRAGQAHRLALNGGKGSFHAELGGRELEAHVEALRSTDHAIIGTVGIAVDATERLVAQRALRLSEQNSRLLIEEAPYAICRVTESGQLLQVNRAMLEMLGYDSVAETELLSRDLPLLFAAPAGYAALQRAFLENGTVQGLETTWVRSNGKEIQVRIGGRTLRDAAGAVLCFDLLAENITDRRQLEERLGQAEKMQAIGQLAGGVAHDFNNLLTIIGMQLEVAREKVPDPDLKGRMDDALRAVERAAALTSQLLAFSRRQVLQTQVVNLNRLIQNLSQMLRRLLREDIELSFRLHPGLGSVRADPNQIEQVLVNLAVNAQDAMSRGGLLTLETSMVQVDAGSVESAGSAEPGEYVVITVRDTGHGMDRETRARIFEPFFTTKPPGMGTGLGLSTAYGIVRQSGGYLQVESRPGEGSTFTVYLPRVAGVERTRTAPAQVQVQPGRETILFAEDEKGVRRLVTDQLQLIGYRVLAAADGAEALQAARDHSGSIDLLLSDLIMPKLGGRELEAALRKEFPLLKTIFISGYAGLAESGPNLDSPLTYFLQKPFTVQELAKMIREVLDGVMQ